MGNKSWRNVREFVPSFSKHIVQCLNFREKIKEDAFEIQMSGITEMALRQCVDFMYYGTVEEKQINLEDLLSAADLLKMFELKEKCIKLIEINLDDQNCVNYYQVLLKYGDANFRKKSHVENMVIENASKLLADQNVLKYMESSTLEMILNMDELQVKDELFLFKAVFDWFSVDKYGRKKNLCNLVSLVRLAFIEKDDFFAVLDKNYRLNNCLTCKKYWLNVVHYWCDRSSAAGLEEDQKQPRSHPIVIINDNCTEMFIFKNINKDMQVQTLPVSNKVIKSHCNAVTFRDGCFYFLKCNGTRFVSLQGKQWSMLSPIPRKHNEVDDDYTARTVSFKNNILVVGGRDGHSLNIVDCYNIESKSWTAFPSINKQRQNPAVVVYNRSVYIIGGNDGSTALGSVERYCDTSNKWVTTARMHHSRYGHSAHVFKGKIFVAGGNGNRMDLLSSVETYREEDNLWINLESLKFGRCRHAMVDYGGMLFVCGGTRIKRANVWEPYYHDKNKWTAQKGNEKPFGPYKSFPIY